MASWYHQFKIFTVATALLLVALVCGAAYWKNQQGFSGRWTIYLEELLKERDITTNLDAFHYSLIDGLVSKNFVIYDPENPQVRLATFEKVAVSIDQQKAAKGDFDLDRISLEGGQIWIKLQDENNNRIHIKDLACALDLTQGYDVIIRSCEATINGIPISLKGKSLDLLRPKDTSEPIVIPEVLRIIFAQLYKVNINTVTPPEVDITLFHETGVEDGLNIDIQIKGNDFSYEDLSFRNIDGSLSFHNSVLDIQNIYAEDDTGSLTLTGSYNVKHHKALFELDSTTNLPKILRTFSIPNVTDKLISPLPPYLQAKGEITGIKAGDDTITWKSQIFGHVTLDEFRLLGTTFRSLDTDFSLNDGRLFLRDMKVIHEQGFVSGKILLMNQFIRYEAEASLPPPLLRPFIKDDGILADNINKTEFTAESQILLEVKGTMQRDKLDEWESSGKVALSKVKYNGVPLEFVESSFIITPLESQFNDISALFNYDAYVPSPYAEAQPSTGNIIAKSIRFDSRERAVHIDQLRGSAWIAPMINLFDREIGSAIDEIVFFTAPPSFVTNGTVALEGNTDKTNLLSQLISRPNNQPSNLYYNLLGQDVLFRNVAGNIRLKGDFIELSNLSARALDGTLQGKFLIANQTTKKPKGGFSGNVSFNNISLARVAERYSFENKTNGALTGRMSFSCLPNDPSALDGEGFIALDNADIFYIPIFGPLSPIMSAVVGEKEAGHEVVKSVSASFIINDGVLYTNDLMSTTPSAEITGDGKIDLINQEMDLTVRTKTRGLLGVITLPLKVLEKFLQFRGVGPISDPKWSSATFNSTPKYIQESQAPNRAIIVE